MNAGELIALAERLNADEQSVLFAMNGYDDFGYRSFKHIAVDRGWEVERARAAVRSAAALGLATYARGLMTEDGQPYGSGYALTEDGLAVQAALREALPDAA